MVLVFLIGKLLQMVLVFYFQVKCIMLQVFRGLKYLHTNFIIHR